MSLGRPVCIPARSLLYAGHRVCLDPGRVQVSRWPGAFSKAALSAGGCLFRTLPVGRFAMRTETGDVGLSLASVVWEGMH
eukprot:15168464-Alexandrium_andersonii.AAC.1